MAESMRASHGQGRERAGLTSPGPAKWTDGCSGPSSQPTGHSVVPGLILMATPKCAPAVRTLHLPYPTPRVLPHPVSSAPHTSPPGEPSMGEVQKKCTLDC